MSLTQGKDSPKLVIFVLIHSLLKQFLVSVLQCVCCCYPGAEQGVEDVVWCGLSSPLQNLRQEQELKNTIGAEAITNTQDFITLNCAFFTTDPGIHTDFACAICV